MYWTDGSIYKGDWVNGIQHGKGIMTFPDGRIKDGEYINNVYTSGTEAQALTPYEKETQSEGRRNKKQGW